MVAAYLLIMLAATWSIQAGYVENLSNDRFRDEIASELKLCKSTSVDSAAYEDGFNKALALAITRHRTYELNKRFGKDGGAADVRLYKVNMSEGGNDKADIRTVRDIEPMTPPTPVIVGSPLYRYSSIIVPEDSFGKDQMAAFERHAEEIGEGGYIEKISGYQDGRFLIPTSLSFYAGEGEETVTLSGSHEPCGKKVKGRDFQDYAVYMPDGSIYGGYDIEGKESVRAYAAKAEKTMKEDVVGSGVFADPNDGIDESIYIEGGSYFDNSDFMSYESVFGDAYLLCVSIQLNPWLYAFKKLKYLYPLAALIMIILAEILITRHNHLLEERLEGEKRRRFMADSMAHEMKTPLSVIHNYGELLLDETDQSRRQEYAGTIIEESESMNGAVVSMLNLSKMEAGTYPMDVSDFSLKKVALDAADRFRVLLHEKGMGITVDVPENLTLFADRELIGTALTNFISNGINHGEPNSLITIRAEAETGESVRISVHNEGAPLAKEDMKKIWDAYYQRRAQQTGSTVLGSRGTGLGLAIVRNICMMHGGQYGCTNEDKGVTFWMRIPSQEHRLSKMDLATGPVLGVTGDRRKARGTGLIAAGTMVQGLFWTFPLYWSLLGVLPVFSVGGAFAMVVTTPDLILSIGMAAGTILILTGLRNMKGGRLRRLAIGFETASLLLGFAICIMTGFGISRDNSTLEGVIHISEIALSLAIAMGFFAVFGFFAERLKDSGYAMKGERMKTRGKVFASVFLMFAALAVTGLTIEMPWRFFGNIWLILSVFAGISWLLAMRGVTEDQTEEN